MAILIRVYSHPIHMGLSFNGLKNLIGNHLQADTHNGDWYLFFNAKRDYLKALWYDGTGFNIHAKKLDTGTFPLLSGRMFSRDEFDKIISGAKVTRVKDTPVKKRVAR